MPQTEPVKRRRRVPRWATPLAVLLGLAAGFLLGRAVPTADGGQLSPTSPPSLWEGTRNMVIQEFPYPGDPDLFDGKRVFRGDEDTWAAIATSISDHFHGNREVLMERWPLPRPLLLPSFAMSVVHHLWGTGPPPDAAQEYGGLMINPYVPESREFPDPPFDQKCMAEIRPRDFLSGRYAECGDYSMLLYMVLFELGREVRLVASPDHVYTEMEVGGSRYVLDAMHNFVFAGSNRAFLDQDPGHPGPYYLFPLRGAYPADADAFRPERGQRRYHYLLTRGRIHRRQALVPEPLNRAAEWQRRNEVPFEAWLAWSADLAEARTDWFLRHGKPRSARRKLEELERLCRHADCEPAPDLKARLRRLEVRNSHQEY